jgi:manganese efflux pump family protein
VTVGPVELKILGIAAAVGLDVLALSIAVGIMQISWDARLRLGICFAVSEVVMQIAGYGLGTAAGRLIGIIAVYLGFTILAGVGVFIVRESFEAKKTLNVDSVPGLLAACAAISLDSLGIGVSLPGVPLPLLPLLETVAISTLIFTATGLAFGAKLGERYEKGAERAAGVALVVLAIVFTVGHIAGWAT